MAFSGLNAPTSIVYVSTEIFAVSHLPICILNMYFNISKKVVVENKQS